MTDDDNIDYIVDDTITTDDDNRNHPINRFYVPLSHISAKHYTCKLCGNESHGSHFCSDTCKDKYLKLKGVNRFRMTNKKVYRKCLTCGKSVFVKTYLYCCKVCYLESL